MRFYEFECKLLLAKTGVPLPHGGTASTPEQARQLATELERAGRAEVAGAVRRADEGGRREVRRHAGGGARQPPPRS